MPAAISGQPPEPERTSPQTPPSALRSQSAHCACPCASSLPRARAAQLPCACASSLPCACDRASPAPSLVTVFVHVIARVPSRLHVRVPVRMRDPALPRERGVDPLARSRASTVPPRAQRGARDRLVRFRSPRDARMRDRAASPPSAPAASIGCVRGDGRGRPPRPSAYALSATARAAKGRCGGRSDSARAGPSPSTCAAAAISASCIAVASEKRSLGLRDIARAITSEIVTGTSGTNSCSLRAPPRTIWMIKSPTFSDVYGSLSAQRFVQHDAHAVDVGAVVQPLHAARLFGRHVLRACPRSRRRAWKVSAERFVRWQVRCCVRSRSRGSSGTRSRPRS